MNGQFQVAQVSGTGNSNSTATPRIFKLTKPLGDQAVVVNLGYDQKVQVDFSAIANEKITLLHVGEKLIILFDNQSTVTVEPFFDSRHDALNNLTIEVAPGRDLSVSEFASSFPISTDQSVLPAAGNGNGNAQASGANFGNPAVDPLPPIPTNILAPPEVLPNFNVTVPTGFIPQIQSTIPTTTPGPTITAGVGPALVVDESFSPVGSHTGPAGSSIDTEAAAASFTVSALAGVQSLTFALTINNATTNLIDSVSGQVVHLVQNGAGEVDGVVTINNVQTNVFTLTVDGAGQVTLTDLRGVHQGTGENGDISEGISLAPGLVSLTATVTDTNNATASASLDLGPQITVHDDGPTIQVQINGEDGPRFHALSVDESFIPNVGSGVGSAVGGPTSNVAAANFSGDFTVNGGADGQLGTTAYSLTLNGGASSLATTLVDSKTGGAVTLVQNGTTEIDAKDAANDVVFKLTVDSSSGIVTLTDLRGVHEGTTGESPDQSEFLTLASNLVSVTATVTDNDGDTASASIDLGPQIKIFDDGPVATGATVSGGTVDEDGLAAGIAAGDGGTAVLLTSSGSVTGLFLSGADAPLHYSFTNLAGLPALSSGGVPLAYAVTIDATTHVETLTAKANGATVFTLTLDETSGATQFTLVAHLDHAVVQGDNNLPINFAGSIQATDSDGDTVAATGAFNVTVIDDIPVATGATVSGGTVDEDGLAAGIAAGDGGTAVLLTSSGSVTGLFLSGADAPLHYSFTNLAGLPALSSGGVPLAYAVTIDATTHVETLTAKANGATVFTLTLDETSGATQFTLVAHLDHAVVQGDNNLPINFAGSIQATDSDGDTVAATGAFNVTVIDDIPVISGIQNAIIPALANTDVQGTWQPVFGADGPSFAPAGAIGIAVGPAPAGLTYTVIDTGTHNLNGEEVFSVAVTGGAQAYNFFEYTHYDASTHTAELFAYTDQADAVNGHTDTTNQFFTLSLAANGTYDFHLTSIAGLTSTVTTSFTGGGNSGEGNFADVTAGAATFVKTGAPPLTPGAGVDLVIDGFNASDPHTFLQVHANNNGFGIANGNFETNQVLNFEFAQSQSAVDLGIGKGNNGVNEHFLITLFDSSHHAFATEDIILPDGQTVLIDSAHFGFGEAPGAPTTGTFGAFSSVTVENIAGANGSTGDDDKLNLTSVSFNEHTTISSTTLNFTPTITDADGDSASTSLSVALNGTSNNGSFTLTGTGNDVLLSGSAADTINLSGNNNTIQYHLPTDGGGTGVGTGDTVNGFNATDSISVSAAGFGGGLTIGEVFNST